MEKQPFERFPGPLEGPRGASRATVGPVRATPSSGSQSRAHADPHRRPRAWPPQTDVVTRTESAFRWTMARESAVAAFDPDELGHLDRQRRA